jgi:cytochrome c2
MEPSNTPESRANNSVTVVVVGVTLLMLVAAALVAVGVMSAVPDQQALGTPMDVAEPEYAAVVAQKVAAANAANGEGIFRKRGCVACHSLEEGKDASGPSLFGLGKRAAVRRNNYTADSYLYESITNPNAYVVPRFSAGVMIQNYGKNIPEEELYDLIAWMKQL